MADMGRRQAASYEPLHTLPLDATFLAPSFESMVPEAAYSEAEVAGGPGLVFETWDTTNLMLTSIGFAGWHVELQLRQHEPAERLDGRCLRDADGPGLPHPQFSRAYACQARTPKSEPAEKREISRHKRRRSRAFLLSLRRNRPSVQVRAIGSGHALGFSAWLSLASPWYPAARLYRQHSPGDWAGVVERLIAELAELRAVRSLQAVAAVKQTPLLSRIVPA
jgi:hypothetical protein